MTIESVKARLREDFGSKEVLDASDIAQVLGKSAEATNTLIRRGGLPLPVFKIGGRNCVSLEALAHLLAGKCIEKSKTAIARPGDAEPLPPPTRKRPNIAAALLCLRMQNDFLNEVFSQLEEIKISSVVKNDDAEN